MALGPVRGGGVREGVMVTVTVNGIEVGFGAKSLSEKRPVTGSREGNGV